MDTNEKRYDRSPENEPARRSYVPDMVFLSKLVGIHAILFAILSVLAYLMELQGEDAWRTIVPMTLLFIALVLLTLVLSLRLAIRTTCKALCVRMSETIPCR